MRSLPSPLDPLSDFPNRPTICLPRAISGPFRAPKIDPLTSYAQDPAQRMLRFREIAIVLNIRHIAVLGYSILHV